MAKNQPILVIHGGAGTIRPEIADEETRNRYHTALYFALAAGCAVLEAGGTALSAVEAAVVSMEDCPLFNAGKGAVFTGEGIHELEAAIMCGKTLQYGGVIGLQTVKNPVKLASLVLHDPRFVLLQGAGAEAYAAKQNVERVDNTWFDTPLRKEQWMKARELNRTVLDHTPKDEKFGTVGAVAVDAMGNLAAATSTGGLTNKTYGLIGDSAIPGAGTYAHHATAAVSCTGYGEFFLRAVAAHRVHALMMVGNQTLDEACNSVIHTDIATLGGEGGLIAVDCKGNVCMPFNTAGMYRAWTDHKGCGYSAMFGTEYPVMQHDLRQA